MTIGRYAPSPSGPLHAGNLRTALLCWMQARLAGGRMRLRIDDLDSVRCKAEMLPQILDDLQWLGLQWDGDIVVQSERSALYQQVFDSLRESGCVFPCRCSRKDVLQATDTPDPALAGPCYPGTCRPTNNPPPFTDNEPVAWRFLVQDQLMTLKDAVLPAYQANLSTSPGDFVVCRKDGVFAYQLASVVDDIEMGVTDVVRGADLLDSTARQVALFQSLGATSPRFWHVPLMLDDSGRKLSKRQLDQSLHQQRQAGYSPAQVIGELAASTGLAAPGEAITAQSLLDRTSAASFRLALRTG